MIINPTIKQIPTDGFSLRVYFGIRKMHGCVKRKSWDARRALETKFEQDEKDIWFWGTYKSTPHEIQNRKLADVAAARSVALSKFEQVISGIIQPLPQEYFL